MQRIQMGTQAISFFLSFSTNSLSKFTVNIGMQISHSKNCRNCTHIESGLNRRISRVYRICNRSQAFRHWRGDRWSVVAHAKITGKRCTMFEGEFETNYPIVSCGSIFTSSKVLIVTFLSFSDSISVPACVRLRTYRSLAMYV